MSEPIVVELRLIEQTFRLNTTEDKREELERAAELLNQNFMICAEMHHELSTINL